MYKEKIRYIKNLSDEDISDLVKESKKEGFNLINKLINDFKSGKNNFSKINEALVVYEADDKIVGVCGLNIDPLNTKRSRIRRLYVLPKYRSKQVGKKLAEELIEYSSKHFESVSVNTGRLNISEFYEKLGFKIYGKEDGVTHLLIH